MLSKERASKKTKFGKKYRQIQQKGQLKSKKTMNQDRSSSPVIKTNKKKSKTKKLVEKIKKNGYESFGSDENVDDQYKKTKAMSRQR